MGFAVIISPAKKMNIVEGPPCVEALPEMLDRTEVLARTLAGLTLEEAREVWKCSEKLAQLNYDRLRDMRLDHDTTAAVLAYEGIQYQHLAAGVLGADALEWLGEHLRILSGFYGVVRPFDGVVPYRLEMQAKLAVGEAKDIYAFWGDTLARGLARDFSCIVNCASQEYAKAVLPFADELGIQVVTCAFCESKNGKLVQRSTEAKAARGSFVRWCAENDISAVADMAAFAERGYAYEVGQSDETRFTFIRN